MPNGISGRPPQVYFALDKPYETNAYDLSQGKRLYAWFGCKSCHGDGQGGIGPSFLDGWWLYGPEMVSIFASIRDGRPHGMPAVPGQDDDRADLAAGGLCADDRRLFGEDGSARAATTRSRPGPPKIARPRRSCSIKARRRFIPTRDRRRDPTGFKRRRCVPACLLLAGCTRLAVGAGCARRVRAQPEALIILIVVGLLDRLDAGDDRH